MNYRFEYTTKPFDMWQLYIYNIYGSLAGVCNIIFTFAMLALVKTFWGEAGYFVKTVLVLACMAFPVFQPIFLYIRVKEQLGRGVQKNSITFNDKGIHVKVGEEESNVAWKKVKRLAVKPTMVVVFVSTERGYILPNRALGSQKNEFCKELLRKIEEC